MDNKTRLRIEEVKQNGFNVNIGDIFSRAWEIFSGIALYAIIAIVISVFAGFLINMILGSFISTPALVITAPNDLENVYSQFLTPISLFSYFLSFLITAALAPINLSILTIAKKFDEHKNPDFNDLFIHYKDGKFMPIFLTYIAIQIIGFIGFVLCFIPGILFYMTSFFAFPLVIFANFAPIDAIKSSVSVLFKNFGQTFVFCLASFGIIVLGVLACGVGLLVALPLVYIAFYVFYKTIIGFGEEQNGKNQLENTNDFQNNY